MRRDARQKAEVGHVIRFVDHGDLDRVEADQALLHQVLEPARAGHDDVDAGSERGDLPGLRDAAEDRGDASGRRRPPAVPASRVIWVASSRVGASTKPDGREARRLPAESLLANGIEKASVFPLPVLPRPRTSRPARRIGQGLDLNRERHL